MTPAERRIRQRAILAEAQRLQVSLVSAPSCMVVASLQDALAQFVKDNPIYTCIKGHHSAGWHMGLACTHCGDVD